MTAIAMMLVSQYHLSGSETSRRHRAEEDDMRGF